MITLHQIKENNITELPNYLIYWDSETEQMIFTNSDLLENIRFKTFTGFRCKEVIPSLTKLFGFIDNGRWHLKMPYSHWYSAYYNIKELYPECSI